MEKSILCATLVLLSGAPSAQAGNTLPYREAIEIGARQCLSTIKAYSDRALEWAPHGADSTWNRDAPDKRLLSFFVSKGRFDGDTQVTMQFAPNAAGGCDAALTESFVVEASCDDYRANKLKASEPKGLLNRRTTALKGDRDNVTFYLTPAGIASNLCLVTRREVAYSAADGK